MQQELSQPCFPGTSSLVAPAIASNFHEVEHAVSVHHVSNFIFSVDDKHLESAGILTDNGFVQTFTFPLIEGDAKTGLDAPRNMVISASYWLQNFTHRVPLDCRISAATALVSVLIAMLTVAFHTIKSAVSNPVNNLKNEKYSSHWEHTKSLG